MPDAGLGNRSRESEEIIRSAGRHLTRDTAFRVNRRDVGAFHRFYEACDKISSLKYEQAEGRGRLLLAPGTRQALELSSVSKTACSWEITGV
jgi:hypothetical protein